MIKYEIVSNDYITISDRKLYRIKALKTFGGVKEGDIGGYVQSFHNLSQDGTCWIYDDAKVFQNAYVADEAKVFGNASVYGNAKLSDRASVQGEAIVLGNAEVRDEALVFNKAAVYDNAKVSGSARVYGNSIVKGCAMVYEKSSVYGRAYIRGNAEIFGHAEAYGHSELCGEAKICQRMHVSSNIQVTTDLTIDKKMSVIAQCNLPVIDNKVVAYKIVNDDLTSLFDEEFRYRVGEIAEDENTDEDESKACSTGLHFSHLTYWSMNTTKNTYLEAEIDLDDIVAVQEGKIRCRKAKILRSFKL